MPRSPPSCFVEIIGTDFRFDPFPLTLTLSRREREQMLARPGCLKIIKQVAASGRSSSGERFSLSQRERAGVRENACSQPGA